MHCIQLNRNLTSIYWHCFFLRGFNLGVSCYMKRKWYCVMDVGCVYISRCGKRRHGEFSPPVCPWCCLLQMCKQCIVIWILLLCVCMLSHIINTKATQSLPKSNWSDCLLFVRCQHVALKQCFRGIATYGLVYTYAVNYQHGNNDKN